MGQLRWGILGTARIADALVRGIRLARDNELIAVASRDVDRARAWARARGVARAYGSYAELIADNDIDAIYNPLPNSMHVEWSIRAAEAHKHVLCEKPIARNAPEVQALLESAEANGVRVMEAFMYRFHPQISRLLQMVNQGAIGELTFIRAAFGFHLTDPRNIRASAELAGGALMDVGCYCVNAARLIAGAEPSSVQAAALWNRPEPGVLAPLLPTGGAVAGDTGVDLSLAGVLEFPTGLMAAVDCSLRTERHEWLSVSGTEGHLALTWPFGIQEEPATLLYDHGGTNEVLRLEGANKYQLMVEHFSAAVQRGTPLAYPLEASYRQMRVIDALYASARSGRRVEL